MSLSNNSEAVIDASWSIFLDRDGVINRRKIGGYIENILEFEFMPGALERIAQLSRKFQHIFIVTNQQGIGKGLFTEAQLEEVHLYMLEKIQSFGGRITKIYYCPNLESDRASCRKPNIGMGLEAKKDHPEIDFHKSIMVGDSPSDIIFGTTLGMKCIGIGDQVKTEDKLWKYFDTFGELVL